MVLSDILMWVFVFLLLLFPLLFLISKIIQVNGRKKPPGPPKLPIIGHFHLLGSSPYRSLWKLSKIYGPVMLLQLGNVPTLVVSSAEAAKDILKTHDNECCSRPASLGAGRLTYNHLDVGFAPYGDYWREMRKICVLEIFSAQRIQSFRHIREEEVALMIESIAQSACSAFPVVNLSDKLPILTASIIFRVAFGKRFRGSEIDKERFEEVVREGQAIIASISAADIFPYVGWIVDRLTGRHARLEKIFHEFDLFYQKVIDDHLAPGRMKQEQEDIIDVMLRLQEENQTVGSEKFTTDHVKGVMMDLFLAGIDTSANTVIWTMTELARHPRAMRKVQDEVRGCLGKKAMVMESDLDKLEYLKMVVKETLRFHPPATLLIPRETMSHFKINGYDIGPKTRVEVNVWAIGRDPDTWENPEAYIPERFVGTAADYKGQDFRMVPFGGGRRGCPGLQMGIATVELVLANLLYSFDWKLPPGKKEQDISLEEGPGVTVVKKSPLELVAIKHEWQSGTE